VVLVYSVSEQAAYHLSELIENHAFNTYDTFLKKNGEMLKSMPVPAIARKYYEQDNPFLFDLFCTVKDPSSADATYSQGRPKLNSLFDVFSNVRDDEREHWKTLCNLVQYDNMQGAGGVIEGTKAAPPALNAAS
jgi:ubiquinol oxidase